VLATLFLAILICFTSCSNSSSPVNSAPKIIGAYTLNGDIICLYDDNTFTIIKDNTVTLSGTYTRDTDGYKLTVGQASDDKATSGDSLVLKVEDDGNISVSQSDIEAYDKGDKGSQTVAPSQPGNPGSDDSSSDIRHSIRDDVSEELKIKENFSAAQNADGIQIKFAIPKDTNSYEVYIDGIGLVTENYFGVGNMAEDDFFYPFLTPNKEYTIQVVFFGAEVEIDGWNYGRPDGDGLIGWFDVKATAGANSKGEVRLNDFGKITVEKNGDFKFTKKPAFENESLIQDWILGIGLSEGVSWLHDDRRSKWLTEIDIPNKEILNKKYNFYTYPRPYGDVTKVDFIVYRPKLFYEYGGKEYKYQWDGYTLDTNCRAEEFLLANIDIKKSEDVAKIQGTWKYVWEGDVEVYNIPCHGVCNETFVISGNNVKNNWSYTYTKRNGSAFTKKEIANWCSYYFSDTLPNDCFYYEEGEFYYDFPNYDSSNEDTSVGESKEDSTGDDYPKPVEPSTPNENVSDKTDTVSRFAVKSSDGKTAYKYKIYTLDSNVTLSSDSKTLTVKYENGEQPLSEYFADYTSSSGSYTCYYDLKLFADGSSLKIICSGKNDNGTDYSYGSDYKKQ
ncbi:MAG: hypothetical protein K2N58_01490, partial [Treponemataceae bacterium]|nr:hypothetical protein [Treponemataceae bacterium]